MNLVHLSLQGKGGIGKSLICKLLAEYNANMIAFDADPVNKTLSKCAGLNARKIQLLDQRTQEVDTRRMDELVEEIMDRNDDVLIDTGASSFVALQAYVGQHHLVRMLRDIGKEIWFHHVLVAGEAQMDCLESLAVSLNDFPDEVEFVNWENEYFGRLKFDLKGEKTAIGLCDTPLWKSHASRLKRHVVMERSTDPFVLAMEDFLRSTMTFAEIDEDPNWARMSRWRLEIIRKEIWRQLDEIFAPTKIKSSMEVVDS